MEEKVQAMFRMIRVEQELIEEISAIFYEMRVGWTKHILNNMSVENILRWQKQADIPYGDLTEEEKNKNREFTHAIMKLMLLHGYDMQGLEALLNNDDSDSKCPKCGNTENIERTVIDLRCPCGYFWVPENKEG